MKNENLLKNIMIYALSVSLILLTISLGLMLAPKDKPAPQKTENPTSFTMIPILNISHEKDDGIEGTETKDYSFKSLWSSYIINHNDTKLPESLYQMGFDETKDCVIYIQKPEGTDISFSIEQDFVYHKFTITLNGISEDTINPSMVYRVNKSSYTSGAVYVYPTPILEEATEATPDANPEYTPTPTLTPTPTPEVFDLLNAMYMSYDEATKTGVLTLDTKGYWCYTVAEDQNGYCISLIPPKSVYSKILVVDAGHGGKDPGALARDRVTWEDDINLEVVLKLKERLDTQSDIKVFYTRLVSEYPSLDDRVNLANGTDADLFLSVHCNSAENSALNGSEVLFNRNQGTEDSFNSKAFANICLQNLSSALGTKLNGLVKADTIKIVRLAQMPVALTELAYLSNEHDFNILKTDEAKEACADALYQSILQAFAELDKIN